MWPLGIEVHPPSHPHVCVRPAPRSRFSVQQLLGQCERGSNKLLCKIIHYQTPVYQNVIIKYDVTLLLNAFTLFLLYARKEP